MCFKGYVKIICINVIYDLDLIFKYLDLYI